MTGKAINDGPIAGNLRLDIRSIRTGIKNHLDPRFDFSPTLRDAPKNVEEAVKMAAGERLRRSPGVHVVVEVGGRTGGAPPSPPGLHVNRRPDRTPRAGGAPPPSPRYGERLHGTAGIRGLQPRKNCTATDVPAVRDVRRPHPRYGP